MRQHAPRGHLVRPYVVTSGRAEPSRNSHRLDVVSLITATEDRPLTGLGPERARVVELCRGGQLSLAEVAAHLRMPMTVTRVLVTDLLDSGHMVQRTPVPEAVPPDADILQKVLHGLQSRV